MIKQEEWRPATGFDGYEVSNLGRVVSHRRRRPRELEGGLDRNGYRKVCLQRGGHQFTRNVHSLVAEAFLGPRPDGLEVRHLNGDKLNNSVSNLSYGTRSENILDAVAHGVHPHARKTHCKHGHEFTPDTTRRYRNGRVCLPCQRANSRRNYERRMFAAANVPLERAA